MHAAAVHPVQVLTRAELDLWGEALGRTLVAPAVIALHGDLGAGKTTLVQAICRGLGVTDEVTSPTFALVHEYTGASVPVFHLDLYRLEGPRDLANLGTYANYLDAMEEVFAGMRRVLRPGAYATFIVRNAYQDGEYLFTHVDLARRAKAACRAA